MTGIFVAARGEAEFKALFVSGAQHRFHGGACPDRVEMVVHVFWGLNSVNDPRG